MQPSEGRHITQHIRQVLFNRVLESVLISTCDSSLTLMSLSVVLICLVVISCFSVRVSFLRHSFFSSPSFIVSTCAFLGHLVSLPSWVSLSNQCPAHRPVSPFIVLGWVFVQLLLFRVSLWGSVLISCGSLWVFIFQSWKENEVRYVIGNRKLCFPLLSHDFISAEMVSVEDFWPFSAVSVVAFELSATVHCDLLWLVSQMLFYCSLIWVWFICHNVQKKKKNEMSEFENHLIFCGNPNNTTKVNNFN